MNKVIVINLNGNAFQVDEIGHDALRAYLDRAESQLRENPDLAEIMADLEQAIGEKCRRFIGPNKNVVTAAEVDQILAEMGPVDPGPAESDGGSQAGAAPRDTGARRDKTDGPAKRLYQIRDGAMISGVCNGLAAYFNIDVTIVRIVFILLAIFTKGAWIMAYIVLMFVIPPATTSEEHAAAQGIPFNAQEVIEQAKKHFADFRNNRDWQKDWTRNWKRQQRHWRRHFEQQRREWERAWAGMSWWPGVGPNVPYEARVLAGAAVPFLGVMSMALFLLFVYALFSLATRGIVFGWPLPANVPLWVALLGLFLLYHLLVAPLKAVRFAAHHAAAGWYSPWAGALEVAFSVMFFWLAFSYVPAFRAFVQGMVTAAGAVIRSGIS